MPASLAARRLLRGGFQSVSPPARAVGPAPPQPPAACFGPDARTEVRVAQNTRAPTLLGLRRVSWTFRVGCPRSGQLYTFGVRQSISDGLELDPPPPVEAPPLVFSPSDEPFKFYTTGRYTAIGAPARWWN